MKCEKCGMSVHSKKCEMKVCSKLSDSQPYEITLAEISFAPTNRYLPDVVLDPERESLGVRVRKWEVEEQIRVLR